MLDSLICLQEAPLKVCVDSNLGGHIVEFSLEGDNALATTGPEIGSTFWPSPQQAWGWPPPNTLDKAPYTVKQGGQPLILESAVCEITGLRVRKSYELSSTHMLVTYTMVNESDKPVSYAPWEITRIYGGLTFYKSDQAPLPVSTGTATELGGFIWHEYQPHNQEQHQKVFGNGSSGWLANAFNGLLLIKQFDPVPAPDVAPGEAEIEIYAHGDLQQPYIEMEQQGRYQTVAPGAEVQWQVRWHLYRLPKDVELKVGNKALPALVGRALNADARR